MATNNKGTKGRQVPVPYRDVASYFKANPQATKQLQTSLQKAGYALGKKDGIYGNRTAAALQKALAAGYTLSNGVLINPQAKYVPSDHASKTSTFLTIPSNDTVPMKPTSSSKAKELQQQLVDAGYYLGTSGRNRNGVDGQWGRKSQAALDKALSEGYVLKGNTLVKVALIPKKTAKPVEITSSTWYPKLTAGENCGTEGCAQYANDALRSMKDEKGRLLYNWNTLSGDAWTRMSSPGVKIIYSGYESEDYDRDNYSNSASDKRNFAAADKFRREFDSRTLDPSKNYIVNMFTRDSSYRGEAWAKGQNGITGTHTGNLYFDQKTGRWRVSHNIKGVIHDDDFIALQGSRSAHGITAIAEAIPIDYSEQDKRDDYRQRKPIRGWIRDTFNAWDFMMRNGGMLIPKAKGGLPISSVNTVPRRWWSGDYEYTTASPTGYDLSSMGIHRTYEGQSTYGNSDSLPIAHALQYINDRIYDLADRYNLSINEARMLLGNTQAVMWNESGGGSSRKINSRTGSSTSNYAYNAKDNNPLYMLGVRTINSILGRDTSEGYGRVKVGDLRKLPYYSKQTEQELAGYAKRSPQFSGLSTFASMAQRYHKLNDIFKDDIHLIYDENGTLNDLGNALLHISHNQGFDNIQKNYIKYKQTGDINELEQYKTFRYPKLAAQIIKGHTIDGSMPVQIEPVVVVANRK